MDRTPKSSAIRMTVAVAVLIALGSVFAPRGLAAERPERWEGAPQERWTGLHGVTRSTARGTVTSGASTKRICPGGAAATGSMASISGVGAGGGSSTRPGISIRPRSIRTRIPTCRRAWLLWGRRHRPHSTGTTARARGPTTRTCRRVLRAGRPSSPNRHRPAPEEALARTLQTCAATRDLIWLSSPAHPRPVCSWVERCARATRAGARCERR